LRDEPKERLLSRLMIRSLEIFGLIPYYMKFSQHVYFAILKCAYFATLKFRDLAQILYFD